MNKPYSFLGGKHEEYPLHEAVAAENVEMVSMLLKAGANVNAVSGFSSFKEPALTEAIEKENIEIVKLLLDAGAKTYIGSEYRRPNRISAKGEIAFLIKQAQEKEPEKIYAF